MPNCCISIVVPTYRESENIPFLCRQINQVLQGQYTYEIIISDDDSQDGTDAVCQQLSQQENLPVRLLTRTTDRGLSPAVIDGIKIAHGEVVIVMDADLSHPPEKITEIAQILLNKQARFVVGSRYVDGGELDKNWPLWRRINSIAATLPAKFLVPLADPMSGFFGLRRQDVAEQLSPIGYKIGLELCVKGNFSKKEVKEVSIHFSDRLHGESKMNLREQLNYLRHLRRLYHYRFPRLMEVFQFLVVGSCGLVVDLFFYFTLLFLGAPHLVARGISYWPALTFNWFFNRVMTFKERPKKPPLKQWVFYAASSCVAFAINWGTYAWLTTHLDFFTHYKIIALFCGVLVGMVFNFIIASTIIFKQHPPHRG